MKNSNKQICNAFSTGGGGNIFENKVQTVFALLMLFNGYCPCLPNWPIVKIKFQGKYKGYNTDDLIVFIKDGNFGEQAKLLGQVKHSISITKSSKEFGEVINAAWNDFNNQELFCAKYDIIALICAPLSQVDTDGVRGLIDNAIYAETETDFIDRINKLFFTGKDKRNKFKVFKYHLKKSNNDKELTNFQLWSFLKVFRLLICDLDMKGITNSLIDTIIEHNSTNKDNSIWTQLSDYVQKGNVHAGSVTLSTIPEEIKSLVKTPKEIPQSFVKSSNNIIVQDWNNSLFANELSFMALLGEWNEKSERDKGIASKLAGKDYNILISKLHELLLKVDSPLVMRNGHWSLKDRKYIFHSLCSQIFDRDFDKFKKCVLDVLKELDIKFKTTDESVSQVKQQQFFLHYSEVIKIGIAEGLALIGNSSKELIHCTRITSKTDSLVRGIFDNSDWKLWASLNNLLPTIAESAPNEFLCIIEENLQKTPSFFNELFLNGGNVTVGWTYINGVISALEVLAWEEDFIVRVTMILGELVKHDTEDSRVNRPLHSLILIFLPWFPQTFASFDKRKRAISNLISRFPDIAWNLLINLLPNKYQTSNGTTKPKWRSSAKNDFRVQVLQDEYLEQVEFYADKVIELSKENISRINEIMNNIDNLPEKSINNLLCYLESGFIKSESEENKYQLWSKLEGFLLKEQRCHTTKATLSPKLKLQINNLAKDLAPDNPIYNYRKWFNGHYSDLFKENMSYQERLKLLFTQRKKALNDIIKRYSLKGVLLFLEKVESPSDVGKTLGILNNNNFDSDLLPSFLDIINDKKENFIHAFILSKYSCIGSKWIDGLNISDWTIAQKTKFYICLPLTVEIWNEISNQQNYEESNYWNVVNVDTCNQICDLKIAVDKLLYYGRPAASIQCIYKILFLNNTFDSEKIVKTLILAKTTKEVSENVDAYKIKELIKYLQNDNTVKKSDLYEIEWNYLALLSEYDDFKPTFLENRLANSSTYFCKQIKYIVRAKHSLGKQITNIEKLNGFNSLTLLSRWSILPGIQTDGSFSGKSFKNWMQRVKKSINLDQLEEAQKYIGKVLLYSPQDSSGFWINEEIAKELDDEKSQTLRKYYCKAIYFSRGIHFIDPLGKPEQKLAQKYNKQAIEAEDKCFLRLSKSLRDLANKYEKDAERIIDQHKGL